VGSHCDIDGHRFLYFQLTGVFFDFSASLQ